MLSISKAIGLAMWLSLALARDVTACEGGFRYQIAPMGKEHLKSLAAMEVAASGDRFEEALNYFKKLMREEGLIRKVIVENGEIIASLIMDVDAKLGYGSIYYLNIANLDEDQRSQIRKHIAREIRTILYEANTPLVFTAITVGDSATAADLRSMGFKKDTSLKPRLGVAKGQSLYALQVDTPETMQPLGDQEFEDFMR